LNHTCRCFANDRWPDGDLSDFVTPDNEERFICALCHLPLHHATLVRLRRHQQELERTVLEPARAGENPEWCRACHRPHHWVRY
jgi:hypothetical protein